MTNSLQYYTKSRPVKLSAEQEDNTLICDACIQYISRGKNYLYDYIQHETYCDSNCYEDYLRFNLRYSL